MRIILSLALLAVGCGSVVAKDAVDRFAKTTNKRAGYDWWSLQPLTRPSPPALKLEKSEQRSFSNWGIHTIDSFILARLSKAGLTPSPPASPRTLIRRATYDLIGLPPSPEEVDAFLLDCKLETGQAEKVGASAYAVLLDRLLASEHYGERWGRHWLDVIRFGESTGLEQNYIINTLWPFRDYVIQSFNEDKPFDQFILEHLAGDVLAPGDPAVEVGLSFLVSGVHDTVGNQDPVQKAQIRANTIDEMIRTTSEAFLGLTVGCARCHDHKFDPVSQRDYYQFYASLAGVKHGERPIRTPEEAAHHRALLKPLEEEKKTLLAEIKSLDAQIIKRAEENIAQYKARWTRPASQRGGVEETFAPVSARFIRLVSEGHDSNPGMITGHQIDEFEAYTAGANPKNVAAAAAGGQAHGKSRTAEDFSDAYGAHLTIDGKFGERWLAQESTLTIEFAAEETIDRVFFSSERNGAPSNPANVTHLAEYRIEVSQDGVTWKQVANSHDRKPVSDAHRRKRFLDTEQTKEERTAHQSLDKQLKEISRKIAAVPAPKKFWVGKQSQPKGPFHIFLRGDPQRKGEEVVAASPKAFSTTKTAYKLAPDAPEQTRRLRLAKMIVAPDNPLTARVIANRLWHYHFGTGLVATPSDFGFMGDTPSHPDLLDWLGQELIEPTQAIDASGSEPWQLKRMHKLIMMSMTYRQSGDYRKSAARIDSDGRLLWRFPTQRLTAEAVRDALLTVAGKMNHTMGGPGFRVYKYMRDNVATYVPLDEHPENTYRRAVYHQNARATRIDLLTEFDAPDCALAAPRRTQTTSPLQALTLMNHDFTMVMAEALAQRLKKEAPRPTQQVERAFLLCFARPPRTAEQDVALKLIQDHGLRAFCRGLFNLNEFVYVN